MTDPRQEMRNLMRAYAAFQMATVFYIVNNVTDPISWTSTAVLILFSISIPSTIAYAGLARTTPEDEKRNPNPISAISSILTFVPSICAIGLIISSASVVAGLIFILGAIIWSVAIIKLRSKQSKE